MKDGLASGEPTRDVDDGSTREILDAPHPKEPLGVPHPVGHWAVYDQGPEDGVGQKRRGQEPALVAAGLVNQSYAVNSPPPPLGSLKVRLAPTTNEGINPTKIP